MRSLVVVAVEREAEACRSLPGAEVVAGGIMSGAIISLMTATRP